MRAITENKALPSSGTRLFGVLEVADFFSARFGKNVWITHHARGSMSKRKIDDQTLQRVIEEGEIRPRDKTNFWIFKHFDNREDNLVCIAVAENDALVVKTVMVNWELEEQL